MKNVLCVCCVLCVCVSTSVRQVFAGEYQQVSSSLQRVRFFRFNGDLLTCVPVSKGDHTNHFEKVITKKPLQVRRCPRSHADSLSVPDLHRSFGGLKSQHFVLFIPLSSIFSSLPPSSSTNLRHKLTPMCTYERVLATGHTMATTDQPVPVFMTNYPSKEGLPNGLFKTSRTQ